MKVLLVSGSYPPVFCGIGDYTLKLSEALQHSGIEVEVLANINWSLRNIFYIKRTISEINPDIIHIQYPSVGYGFSLVPQLLSLMYKTIVTIHEVSQSYWMRKLSLMPFSFRSTLIFTNSFELSAFKKIFPWRTSNCHIVPIGSNISVNSNIKNTKDRNFENIVYFGQIRPQKGLESVVELAKLIKENNLNYRLIVVSQLFERFKSYYEYIFNSAKDLNIEWKLNLSESNVGEILSSNALCYLPFPDGASERRGSLFAALNNKMLVFTTEGTQITPSIKKSVLITDFPNDVIGILRDNSKNTFISMANAKQNHIEALIKSISWPEIAKSHTDIYSVL